MSYLLDTNHCIYLKNGWITPASRRKATEENTLRIFEKMSQQMVYMSEASVGELIFGAVYSQKKEYNLERIEKLKKAVPPISVDLEVWTIFGETKALLRKSGKVIPDIDLLIASTAKRYDLILVTNDTHMELLPSSFKKVNWADRS